MSKIEHLRLEFGTSIPAHLEEGVLYISLKYKTASHLCCCGCKNKVVTPLKPGGWELTTTKGTASLYPSIGSWSLPCHSHYWIRKNKIVWAPRWSLDEIEAGREEDRLDRTLFFDAPPKKSMWKRIINFILRQ